MSEENRIIKVSGAWYIETLTGYAGPFDNKLEAKQYIGLLRSTEAARCEFAGLQYTVAD